MGRGYILQFLCTRIQKLIFSLYDIISLELETKASINAVHIKRYMYICLEDGWFEGSKYVCTG